jgi:hypothetical protein
VVVASHQSVFAIEAGLVAEHWELKIFREVDMKT